MYGLWHTQDMHMRNEPEYAQPSSAGAGGERFYEPVVRWLLLDHYLCFSGLFLYERG